MLFSIIIPIFNAEKYLRKTLDSVLGNSGDYEVILVNDGSIDNSLKICEEYEKKYGIVKCFTQDNRGVSSARNLGIENATGDYIIFVDSDDYIDEYMIKNLTNTVKGKEYVFLSYGYDVIERGKTPLTNYIGREFKDVSTINDINNVFCKYAIENEINSVWNKVFKRDIIEKYNIKFGRLKYGEDLCFVLDYLSVADGNCLFVDDIYYHMNVNYASATHTFARGRYKDELTVIEAIMKYTSSFCEKKEGVDDLIKHKCRMLIIYELYNMAAANCKLEMKEVIGIFESLKGDGMINNSLVDYEKDRLLERKQKWILFCIENKFYRLVYIYITMKRIKGRIA